ncbi:DUF1176 domain-containing protein [Psychrobacter arenosus]|uniref:DUF1176 domain-containing protein n=1 Tax=Psychrobacter arenosus TaxID=256326 RepID=UPI0019192FA7|nr:DUF1176 domain-containing protein [Psychrobacter arenosus]
MMNYSLKPQFFAIAHNPIRARKIKQAAAIIGLSGLGLLTAITAQAENDYRQDAFQGEGFVKEDWQVVCDNTLTCRAAGYGMDRPATILLTAIPKNPVTSAQVQLENINRDAAIDAALGKANYQVELRLNNKSYGKIKLDAATLIGTLNDSQTQQLLAHARQSTEITLNAGSQQWEVRDGGMAAVLLKLDEIQGRVGTPLALISKNASQKLTPKAAKPKPIIRAAPVYSETEAENIDVGKLQYWRKNISQWVQRDAADFSECENFDSAEAEEFGRGWQFDAIDANHTLASYPCWLAAYNYSNDYWVINHAQPSQPTLVASATDYSEGVISNQQKGRGVGDCWSSESWVWNGKTFAKSSEMTTGLCRAITGGGAWELPTYVSEVIKK